jgi:subtilisin family serine protease
VGVIDTGIDASHPDIAPNLDVGLSRNFTTDDPVIDGACATDPDGSCEDPATVDEDGHGTHVAGTIASPLNGVGIAGVAPGVKLVNLRAGQDSGYFFLGPTVDALTYAGDHGVDVVNMSFYVDPWLYNCPANPADSPAAQLEQRTAITAIQRALDYARARGVTLISAEGNGNTDLGRPITDLTSPDYPPDSEVERTVDNSCITLPTESDGVISVTSVGRSGRKAIYSDYGLEQADVAAPGGDSRDFFGTSQYKDPANLILAPYPAGVGRVDPDGDGPEVAPIDAAGQPTTPSVLRQVGPDGTVSYYQYIQGTSMASPHAVGVAALIVSRYGHRDRPGRGLTLDPAITEKILLGSATETACPEPRTVRYPEQDLPADDPDFRGPEYTATCEGTPERNGFYGSGVVNAARAVSGGRH